MQDFVPALFEDIAKPDRMIASYAITVQRFCVDVTGIRMVGYLRNVSKVPVRVTGSTLPWAPSRGQDRASIYSAKH